MSRVALNDTAKLNESKVRFEVLGDDKVLWTSKDVTKPKNVQSCDISVLDINTLELRVHRAVGRGLPAGVRRAG